MITTTAITLTTATATILLAVFTRHFYKKLIISRQEVEKIAEELKKYKFGIRSAYVKFGKTFEHFAPFTSKFPADKGRSVFLGQPIDFIAFEEDSIKFIEVKTGNSSLSEKQCKIRDLISRGKVEFKELRY